MFAYCFNNPTNLVDFTGNIPRELSGFFPHTYGAGGGLSGVGGSYIPVSYGSVFYEDTDVLQYNSNGKNNGAQIENSCRIKNPYNMYVYIQGNRGDEIVGSSTGVVYEWIVHNIAYEIGESAVNIGFVEWGNNFMNKGQTLDVGRTIYADSHGPFSVAMWTTYFIASPTSAIYDLVIHIFAQRGA